MTSFLADENVPGVIVSALRSSGRDVTWVAEIAPGLRDETVLTKASLEGRILLTFDKDFGDLARHRRGEGQYGIVLVRAPKPATAQAAERLAALLASRQDWAGHLTVIEPGRIRRRPLNDA